MSAPLFESPTARAESVRFTVYGIAQPKGSTKAFAFKRPDESIGTRTTSTNKNLAQWAELVRSEAQRFASCYFERETALDVSLEFALPRPKSLPKRVVHNVRKPDVDKLVRAIYDALTGVLFHDDAQVVDGRTRKRYAARDEAPHVRIMVSRAAP